MKSATSLVLGLLMLTIQSQAAQYIVENKTHLSFAKFQSVGTVKDVVSFGDREFVILESPKNTNQVASVLGADNVKNDYIVAPLNVERKPVTATTAWHVNRMKYSSLPASANGKGVVVAVLDSGVDVTHSALKNHIWVNTKEIAANSIDDDHNGFVDDVNGWDFGLNSNNTIDNFGHGSHCAGIIAADADPATGAQGVAQGAKIMVVRIYDGPQGGFLSNVAKGIKYAVDNGAKVLSNSYRVYKSWDEYAPSPENVAILEAALKYADDHGVIYVAAAGNETLDVDTTTDAIFPVGLGGHLNLLGVAASNETDAIAYFSNWGKVDVQVASPGNNIISTTPGDMWESMSGTSMATPLTAGAIARGLSAGMTVKAAINNIQQTTQKLAPWQDKVASGGIIDIVSFLK